MGFHLGGFPLPFLVLGGAMIIQSSVSVVILCIMNMKSEVITETPNVGFKEALLIPRVLLATLAVFTASLSIGFLMTTLERYISRFETSTLDVGLFFMVYGLSYACPNPFWGLISDKSSPSNARRLCATNYQLLNDWTLALFTYQAQLHVEYDHDCRGGNGHRSSAGIRFLLRPVRFPVVYPVGCGMEPFTHLVDLVEPAL